MNWKGKLIGALIGLLTRRWQLVLLGLALGHVYDIGVFKTASPSAGASPPPPQADPYAVLGISVGSSDEEIEQAYRRKMSEYHPDRVANAAEEIRALAETRARDINAAYETIRQQRKKG
jgi:DnaJ-domain-containing protein 1